jgi:hypothetical protein
VRRGLALDVVLNNTKLVDELVVDCDAEIEGDAVFEALWEVWIDDVRLIDVHAVVVTVEVLLRDPVTVTVMVLVDDDEIDTVTDVESDDVELIITLDDDEIVAEIERVTLTVADVDRLDDW